MQTRVPTLAEIGAALDYIDREFKLDDGRITGDQWTEGLASFRGTDGGPEFASAARTHLSQLSDSKWRSLTAQADKQRHRDGDSPRFDSTREDKSPIVSWMCSVVMRPLHEDWTLAEAKKSKKVSKRHKMGDDHDFDESAGNNLEASILSALYQLRAGYGIPADGMAQYLMLRWSLGAVRAKLEALVAAGKLVKNGELYACPDTSSNTGRPSTKIEGTEVADTIAQQLGGIGRIRMMLGAKKIVALANGLMIQWPNKDKSKGNSVVITLRPDDTYDMEFFALTGKAKAKSIKKFEMVYVDQLLAFGLDASLLGAEFQEHETPEDGADVQALPGN